jgi:hypothetical protein
MIAIETPNLFSPQQGVSSSFDRKQKEEDSLIRRNAEDSKKDFLVRERRNRSLPREGCQQVFRASPKAASASYIRSRFLNHLGISKAARDHMDGPEAFSRPRAGSFQEKLKADYGKPDNNLGNLSFDSTTDSMTSERSCINSSASSECGDSRGVCFDSTVTVHPIPTRSEYSKRIRSTLWTPYTEIQQNAARNSHEFAAENWDWRQVANDEDMVLYEGEKIHPSHFVQECSLRRRFLQVMSARNHR